MSETNKVRFGLSNLHIGTYTVAANGTVTMGSPVAQTGAVSLTLDPETAESVFYADNEKYYVEDEDNGFTGELETAKFDDDFLTTFLNYVAMSGGGVGQVANRTKPKVYIAFEIAGDVHARRTILYNVTLGNISFSHSTTEDTKEPQTETLPFTVLGDDKTKLVKATFNYGDTQYSTLFTAPTAPTLPA